MTITDIKTFLTTLIATKAQVARMEDLAMRTMDDGSVVSKKEWAAMETVAEKEEEREAELKEQYLRIMHCSGE